MRKIILFIAASFFYAASVYAQPEVTNEYVNHEIGKGRQYIVVILKINENDPIRDDSTQVKEQEEHLRYLFTLKEQGKLPVFGPFFNAGELSGLCIFNSDNKAEVKRIIEADPHVKAGHLLYEIYQWFSIPGFALP